MKDLVNGKLLSDLDSDHLASVVANLLEEIITLSERVAKLEGEKDEAALQDRINRTIDRVMLPLA